MQSFKSFNKSDILISKRLSWLLRHGALKQGLNLSSEGFVSLASVLRCRGFESVCVADIERIVKFSDKQRFTLRRTENGLEIRANQGHSLTNITNLELTPIINVDQVENVIHGTYFKFWASIKEEGLFRGERNHIHFSEYLPNDNNITGIRRSAEIYIYINLHKSFSDGLLFFKSCNNVILSPGNENGYIKPHYFLKNNITLCPICKVPLPNKQTEDVHNLGKKHQLAEKILKYQEKKESCGIFIKGLPIGAKVEVVRSFFSTYGEVVECFISSNNHYALVQFKSPEPVNVILRSKIQFNGKYLNINRRITRKKEETDRKPEESEMAVFKFLTKSESFDNQVIELKYRLQPNWTIMEQNYNRLCNDLHSALSEQFPNCIVHPFGSTVTRLSFNTSDVDVYVQVFSSSRTSLNDNTALNYINISQKLLRKHQKFSQVRAIPKAKTPIVKCVHIPTRISCDFNFKNMLGVCNTNLIEYYLSLDNRLPLIMIIIKYWAKVHEILGTGKFSSYSLIIMFIFYLQANEYLIPSVRDLQMSPNAVNIQEGWNGGFNSLSQFTTNLVRNFDLHEILLGFFEYYAKFDYVFNIICPYLGYVILKTDIAPECLKNEFDLYKSNIANQFPLKIDTHICVQDPFQHNRNILSSLPYKLLEDFVHLCEVAVNIFKKSIDNFTLNKLFSVKPKHPVKYIQNVNKFNVGIVMSSCFLTSLNYMANLSLEECTEAKVLKLRTVWFTITNKYIIDFLTQIMKFTVTVNDSEIVKESNVEDLVDAVSFICTGQYNVWDNRKNVLKDINLDNSTDFWKSQIYISNYIYEHMKKINIKNGEIKCQVTAFAKVSPVRMDIEVINFHRNQHFSLTFASFFCKHFSHWFEKYCQKFDYKNK
ncbi:hypothetical protein FQA39_LY06064 [Lamprigera yunnana]|nr:hypothetical protein FQA39_LY06064 [Lamprigera yunnana]